MKTNLHHKIKRKLPSSDYIRILILRTVGNFLILISLFLIAKTFYQPVREEIRFAFDQINHKQYVVVPPGKPLPKGLLAQALQGKKIEFIQPVDPQFDIVIPKIDANSRILAQIDASNENEYLAALKQGVAQARGTDFPGEGGHIYLFAHSTDYFWNVGTYNAVFYLLGKLGKGDEVDLFYKGQRYLYQVVGTTIVDPSQTEYLTRKTNREFLTLQTCWPPGTTLKRLLVFATRVAE